MAGSDQDGPSDEAAMRARLDNLSTALQKQRQGSQKRTRSEADEALVGQRTSQAIGLGFRVLSEFVAGIIVGALLGWWLDGVLGTSPWLLIVFLTLGTAAGFWNVYRIAAKPTA